MTDWGTETPLTENDIRSMGDMDLADSYWVFHPNVSFNGDVGVLHFTSGKAAFSAWYLHSRNRADWFEPDGGGGYTQKGMLTSEGASLLNLLLLCWRLNGFTIAPMNGGQAEFDELVPDESPFLSGDGGEESMTFETPGESAPSDGAGEAVATTREEEVTSNG